MRFKLINYLVLFGLLGFFSQAFAAPKTIDCRHLYETKLHKINAYLPPEKQWRIVDVKRVQEAALFAWSEPSGIYWDEILYTNNERVANNEQGIFVKRSKSPGKFLISGWDLRDTDVQKDKASFFFSANDRNSDPGVFSFGVRTKRRFGEEREGVVMSASDELQDALLHFSNPWAIQDVWVREDGVPSDNLNQFNDALKNFTPPYTDAQLKAAALNTWTGRQALMLGYTSVELVPNTFQWDETTQSYSVASFLFSQP